MARGNVTVYDEKGNPQEVPIWLAATWNQEMAYRKKRDHMIHTERPREQHFQDEELGEKRRHSLLELRKWCIELAAKGMGIFVKDPDKVGVLRTIGNNADAIFEWVTRDIK